MFDLPDLTDVVEIVVDFAELAIAETEAAASEAAQALPRAAKRWNTRPSIITSSLLSAAKVYGNRIYALNINVLS